MQMNVPPLGPPPPVLGPPPPLQALDVVQVNL